MKPLDLEGLKKVELEILDVVAKFCDEHGINYGLNAGTLIGAVRHKGFIPWDDDIDLLMLRHDYDKFTELFNKYNTRYHFCCAENEPDFPIYWGKVFDTNTKLLDTGFWDSHVFVDIFCWDNAPDNERALKKMNICKHILRRLSLMQFFPLGLYGITLFNFPKKIIRFVLSCIIKIIPSFIMPKNYFVRKMIVNAKKYMNENTKRLGNFLAPQNAVASREAFERFIDAEFEGGTYKIPIGYDEILRGLYGDYMTLPPEEERVTNHEFEAYIKE